MERHWDDVLRRHGIDRDADELPREAFLAEHPLPGPLGSRLYDVMAHGEPTVYDYEYSNVIGLLTYEIGTAEDRAKVLYKVLDIEHDGAEDILVAVAEDSARSIIRLSPPSSGAAAPANESAAARREREDEEEEAMRDELVGYARQMARDMMRKVNAAVVSGGSPGSSSRPKRKVDRFVAYLTSTPEEHEIMDMFKCVMLPVDDDDKDAY